MELIIIVLLIVYALFKDILFYREREALQMKLMSRDLSEYVTAKEPEAEDTPQKEDPFVPLEEASIEQILKSKDRV